MKIFVTLAMLFSAILLLGMSAKAETGLVTELKQKDATKTSVTLEWQAATGATEYEIWEYSLNGAIANLKGKTTATNTTINGLKPGEIYIFTIVPTDGSQRYPSMMATANNVKTVAEKPSDIVSVYRKKNQVQLSWDASKAYVDGYEIQLYNGKKKVGKKINITGMKNSATIKKVDARRFYRVRMRSYVNTTSGKRYSNYATHYTANHVQIVPRRADKNIRLTWTRVTGATGYTIYVRRGDKGKFQKLADVKKNTLSYTIKRIQGKKLKRGREYSIYVIARKKVKGVTYQSVGAYGLYKF